MTDREKTVTDLKKKDEKWVREYSDSRTLTVIYEKRKKKGTSDAEIRESVPQKNRQKNRKNRRSVIKKKRSETVL